jgi:hypothetical protein
MLEGISLVDLGSWGGWTVLAVFLALGWLVPKRTVDREQKLLQREADGWRTAYETQAEQLGLLLEQLRTPPPPAATSHRLTRSAATDGDERSVT